MLEVQRKTDILGNATVENKLNYGLYYVFEKSPGDDSRSTFNADWVQDFQEWVQEQSIKGLAPKFGENQTVKAENGMLYDADTEGTATYMIQLSIQFEKTIEV